MERADFEKWARQSRGLILALFLHAIVAAGLVSVKIDYEATDFPDPVLVEIMEIPVAEDEIVTAKTIIERPVPEPADTEPVSAADQQSEPVSAAADTVLPSTAVMASPHVGQVRSPVPGLPDNAAQRDAARRTVAALMCARLNPSQRINCPTGALDDETVAVLVADARAAEQIYTVYAAFTPPPPTMKEIARARQVRAYDQKQVTAGPSNTGLDESGLVNAYPSPLWDGYRDPAWNDE